MLKQKIDKNTAELEMYSDIPRLREEAENKKQVHVFFMAGTEYDICRIVLYGF